MSGIGIITTDTIWVLFDREIDEAAVQAGNFFVEGPDFDTWSGPDLLLYHDYESVGSEEEILQSPGYHGIVQGTITFQRISTTDPTLVVSTQDTVGSGLLYRSKAIFTPTERLAPNTDYTVYLTGDEDSTDSLQTGISTRTVFDPITNVANIGNGEITTGGSYTGTIVDTFNVEITAGGAADTAIFHYWKSSAPFIISSPIKTKQTGVLLKDGVYVYFGDGVFEIGDRYTCLVEPRDIFEGNIVWVFKTGSGSIEELPDTVATTLIGEDATATATAAELFEVESTDPSDGASHQTIPDGEYTITVVMSDDIDPATVVSGISITVVTESVNGDIEIPASGVCVADPQVSGDTITITVASGYLLENNLVTVTLDSSIASTTGTFLASDYDFWFTTTYNPYYCTLRKIQLEIGAYLSTVADDTINFAIFEGGLQADALTWNADYIAEAYYLYVRSRWTCCKAQETLLLNTVGVKNNLRAKQLGDLRVEYQAGVSDALDKAVACLTKLEPILNAGGRAVQTPSMVVKGELDPDKPPIGRGWNTSTFPAANTRVTNTTTTRRYWNIWSNPRKGKGRYDA